MIQQGGQRDEAVEMGRGSYQQILVNQREDQRLGGDEKGEGLQDPVHGGLLFPRKSVEFQSQQGFEKQGFGCLGSSSGRSRIK